MAESGFAEDRRTAILDAFEASLWVPFSHAAGEPWIALGDETDHRWALTGIAMGAFNAVSHARLEGDLTAIEARVDAILGRFAQTDTPMSWWVLETSRPVDLAERLGARGLTLTGPLPVLGLAIDGWRAPAWPDGLDIAQVDTADGFTEACRVVSDGYPVPWAAFRGVAVRFGGLFARGRELRCYVARDGSRAVSSAVAYRDGPIVGLWNLATLPDARRRGAATAVTIAALEDARADGCRLAVLASTDAARSLYRRLGFRHAGELVIAGRGALIGD